jgi:hypothetical protein
MIALVKTDADSLKLIQMLSKHLFRRMLGRMLPAATFYS